MRMVKILSALILAFAATSAAAQTGSVSGASVRATGTSTSRILANSEADFIRATQFGAKFDTLLYSGGTIAAGSTTFSNSAGVTFTSADIGKRIILLNGGTAGKPLSTTITAVNGTQATLNTAAISAQTASYFNSQNTALAAPGTGYKPLDKIVTTGGTGTSQATMLVTSTKVVSAVVVSGGSGGTNGACTITGTTGNNGGTTKLFTATGTVTGGALGGALTITLSGPYKDNPEDITTEPVTSNCGLVGTTVSVVMGVATFIVYEPGSYSVAPSNPVAQGSTTGTGTGATFTGAFSTAQQWFFGTDDTTAIQAAIDFCEAKIVRNAVGCSVMIPTGTAIISTTLTINKSLVGLYSLSKADRAMSQRNVTGIVDQTFPTRLLWGGNENGGYMVKIGPLVADGLRLYGSSLVGVALDCWTVRGCGGLQVRSVAQSDFRVSISEPSPREYVTSGATAAGSATLALTSATGIELGQIVTAPNLLSGTYVAGISGTTITLSSQAYYAGIPSGKTVLIGGEASLWDVQDEISTNDTQENLIWLWTRTLQSMSPGAAVGGSAVIGPSYGNFSLNRIEYMFCWSYSADCLVANNSDHNIYESIGYSPAPSSYNVGAGYIGNGTLSGDNGNARSAYFFRPPTSRFLALRGTSSGGYTSGSHSNTARQFTVANGVLLSIDTAGGAELCATSDSKPAIGCFSTQPLTAQMSDSTAVGGNDRGANATDLQAVRSASTMVAGGDWAAIGGGKNNTANADSSVVVGGEGNTAGPGLKSVALGGVNNIASGTESVVLGGDTNQATATNTIAGGNLSQATAANAIAMGNATVASQTHAVAFGEKANADKFGVQCHGGGVNSSGKRVQHCRQLLKGVSGANTTPFRLTADLAAAGSANCANINEAGSVFTMRIELASVNSSAPGTNYSWVLPNAFLTRPTSAASSTTLGQGTPLVLSTGTVTGLTVVASADTTNACLNLTFTPQDANTGIWRVGAAVYWTQVD